jgi:hypothetical protein
MSTLGGKVAEKESWKRGHTAVIGLRPIAKSAG